MAASWPAPYASIPLTRGPHPQERSPLHDAAEGGHLEVVRELVGYGAAIKAVDVSGWVGIWGA